jgi:hypothetical protein
MPTGAPLIETVKLMVLGRAGNRALSVQGCLKGLFDRRSTGFASARRQIR